MARYAIFGTIIFDRKHKNLISNGQVEKLEPRLAHLLDVLLDADGALPRSELMSEIWGTQDADEALTQAVSRVRKALGDGQRPYQYLLTVPRQGYRLCDALPRVDSLPAQAEIPPQATDEALPTEEPRKWRAPNPDFLKGLATGLILCLVALAVWRIVSPPLEIVREIDCFEGSESVECSRAAEGD